MNNRIKKVEIDGETIYLKKQKFTGWGVVYPSENEDGTTNWFNAICGNKRGLVQLIVIGIIMLLVFLAMNSQLAACRQMAKHPALYFSCADIQNDLPKENLALENRSYMNIPIANLTGG